MAEPRRHRRLRVLGHPVHPALAAFPIAFLSGSVLANAVALLRADPFWWAVSFWVVVAGVLAAIPAAGAGLVDYTTIGPDHAALKTATVHLTVMLVAVGCFGVDLLLRGGPVVPRGMLLPATVVLDLVGAAVLTVGGWYGGHLVFHHGVGRTHETASAAPSGDDSARFSRDLASR